MKNVRLVSFILVSCVLGLLAAVGFYLAFAPDEGIRDAPLSQAEMRGPLMRLGQPPRPVSILTSTPTPTPTPIPTPTPTPILPPPPPSEPTREEFTALVNAAFPDDPRMGGHVVWNESLRFEDGVWQGYVYGGVWSETGDCGLMQINWYYHSDKFAAHGWTEDDCFVPERNLVVAREIYNNIGCGAWSTCY